MRSVKNSNVDQQDRDIQPFIDEIARLSDLLITERNSHEKTRKRLATTEKQFDLVIAANQQAHRRTERRNKKIEGQEQQIADKDQQIAQLQRQLIAVSLDHQSHQGENMPTSKFPVTKEDHELTKKMSRLRENTSLFSNAQKKGNFGSIGEEKEKAASTYSEYRLFSAERWIPKKEQAKNKCDNVILIEHNGRPVLIRW